MTESVRTTVKCHDPGGGSGNLITDLLTEVLAAMNMLPGDLLSIELDNGAIVLNGIRDANTIS